MINLHLILCCVTFIICEKFCSAYVECVNSSEYLFANQLKDRKYILNRDKRQDEEGLYKIYFKQIIFLKYEL